MSEPSSSQLSISLETHLVEVLRPLVSLLPPSQRAQLAPYVSSPSRSSIPYALLQSISQWTRSSAGNQALRSTDLNPNDYSMIALLAGSKTSPASKLPPYEPPKEADEIARERHRERKAIGIIVNGVFSVVGTGAAAWWGSKHTGWKHEWRLRWQRLCSMYFGSNDKTPLPNRRDVTFASKRPKTMMTPQLCTKTRIRLRTG
ncbi:hypothetical protein PM082_010661 [Marasmius tenuissimus]|nr:hypothetical protein PM082_010661 [Marasmius tenuissimus]